MESSVMVPDSSAWEASCTSSEMGSVCSIPPASFKKARVYLQCTLVPMGVNLVLEGRALAGCSCPVRDTHAAGRNVHVYSSIIRKPQRLCRLHESFATNSSDTLSRTPAGKGEEAVEWESCRFGLAWKGCDPMARP